MPKETIQLERAVIPITDAERAARFVGDAVSVDGVAVNRDHSAAIEVEDTVVHLLDLPEWPEDVLGKTVSARGELGTAGEGEAEHYTLGEVRYEVAGEEASSADSSDESDD